MEAAHCKCNKQNQTTKTEQQVSELKRKKRIEICDRRGIFDLIGVGIANEEHLERVAEHDSSVIPLVDARLHDLHVFLPHCHLLLRSLARKTLMCSSLGLVTLEGGDCFVLFLALEIGNGKGANED